MTKTSILCYEKNGGGCRNKVSPVNNYICAAGHGGSRQGGSVLSGLQKVTPVINLTGMSVVQKRSLAQDPSTSPETLAQLAEDKNWNVRAAVASSSSTPPETLAKMAGDKNSSVRYAVADNPSTLPETHIYLAQEGYSPHGFTEGKPIDELIKDIDLLEKYPATFGRAYLYRLIQEPTSRDESHPKRRALIGYAYAKLAESDKPDFHDKQICKDSIQALFPDDQEMAEIVGC